MGRAVSRRFDIVVYRDNGIVRIKDSVTTSRPAVARQRTIAIMKARNSPFATVTCLDGCKYYLFEVIYGTPMGTMYWCDCKRDFDNGYGIFPSGVPGAKKIENIWFRIERDIPFTISIEGYIETIRSNGWMKLETL